MPFYKFKDNDIYVNTVKTHPQLDFLIYKGTASYNNTPTFQGRFANPIIAPAGDLSLYELNVDRVSASTGRIIGVSGVNDNGLIYSWMVKSGDGLAYRTTTPATYDAKSLGSVLIGAYPLTASLTQTYYAATTPRVVSGTFTFNAAGASEINSCGSVTRIRALKNTIDYYRYLSPHYKYAGTSSGEYPTRSFNDIDLGLISIPSIFYGEQIQKGTVDLQFYFTGNLAARAVDRFQNGELIQTEPYGSPGSGTVVGLVLYTEGIIILTGSRALNGQTDSYLGAASQNPRWIYFGGETVKRTTGSVKSTFRMSMSGTNRIPTLTMFATAPKAQLNHSNNPSYKTYTTTNQYLRSRSSYVENPEITIKNIVSSAYADPTASFERTTYISKIGLYDENHNLIAIAKPATPVKKTAERDLTFKLKLDL